MFALHDTGPIDPQIRGRYRCRQRSALQCHHFAGLHVPGHEITWDNVIVQDCLELRGVLEHCVIRAGWKFLECFISRRENRERAFCSQRIGEPRCLNALAKDVKLPAAITVSTMFFVGAVLVFLAASPAGALFD